MPHPHDGPFWRWDAADIARAVRLGRVSTREVAEDALARLAAANPAINAVVLPLEREALAGGREDLALDAAEAIEAAWPMPTPVEPRGRLGVMQP